MLKKRTLALLLAATFSGSLLAQAKTLDIPAQTLGSALTQLATQGGIQILFDAKDIQGVKAQALRGDMNASTALNKLLEGSGLEAKATGPQTFVIQKASQNQIHTLKEIQISAPAEHSYKADKITVAGKVPLTAREIPQSVSVITRSQIEDQGLSTLPEALAQVSGVTMVSNDTLNSQYWSRGYGLGFMYDGVPSYNTNSAYHQFDLPIYERVEVLKGPAGLLRGVGEPGGVVNLVKKKPQQDFGLSWATTIGSWNTKKVEGDITGALNQDKSLRGRLVMATEDRNFFYDHTKSDKWLVMGALEYDLNPSTILSLSMTSQDADVKAPWSGLPASSVADASGHYPLLDVPRSTFYVPDWGKLRYHTDEISAGVERKFDNGWTAKLAYNHREQNQYYKYAYTSSGLNLATGKINYSSFQGDYDYTRDGADFFATGPFMAFGRKHQLTLGYNTEVYNSKGKSGTGPAFNNVTYGDVSTLIEPNIAYTSGSENEYQQSGLSSQLRLSLADPLTAILGGRTTTFKAKSRKIAPSAATAWADGAKASNEFTPYGGLIYDLTKEVSLYASYADIFVPQTQKKIDGSTLDPRVGRQYELGSKAELLDGKLAASLAMFNLRDKNRAFQDPADASGNSYLNAGEVESKGWEAEVSGKPVSGLDLSAGYTNQTTRYLKDKTSQGKTYSIFTPRNQFRLWSNYRFAPGTSLAGWNVGLGMLYNSSAQSTRGWRDELVNKGYSVFNGQIGYQIDKTYTLTMQVNNLLDKKYYATVGTPNIYNFYGEPRNVMLTLRARY